MSDDIEKGVITNPESSPTIMPEPEGDNNAGDD